MGLVWLRKHTRFCDPHDVATTLRFVADVRRPVSLRSAVSWVKELNSQPNTVTPPLFSVLPPASGRQNGKKRVICFDILAVKLFHQPGKPAGVNVTKSN